MNKNYKVTIIVQVYNVEQYIEKCVDSILRQNYKNIEIILVDDGSTDLSGTKCDLYLKDKRVKVIHKKNGGLSEARNYGVEAAIAPYIGFVDSDDYIEPDMYEVLYTEIMKEKADIAFCGLYDCYVNKTKISYAMPSGRFTTNAEEAIRLVLEGKNASVSAVNKLYKKEIVKKNLFLVGKTSEDAHFIIPYLTYIQKAAFNMAPKYYYVHRKGTITTSSYKKSDLSICEAYLNNRKIIEEKFPNLIEVADFRYYWSLFYILDKMFLTKGFVDKIEKNKIISEIKKQYSNIIRNPHVGSGRKIALKCLMVHPFLYQICLNMYTKKNKKLFNK